MKTRVPRNPELGRVRTHPSYNSWHCMMRRCYDPKSNGYPTYGALGIVVCEKWRTFEGFVEDMGLPPFSGASLGRINNAEGYHPSNCRWETISQQNRNRNCCLMLTHNGVTSCAVEWSERIGIPAKTLYTRKQRGWTDEQIVTMPVWGRRKTLLAEKGEK